MKNAKTKAQKSFAMIKCEPTFWERDKFLMLFQTAPAYVKDVDEALERNVAKKVVYYRDNAILCSDCKKCIAQTMYPEKVSFCKYCGCRLDWGGEDE